MGKNKNQEYAELYSAYAMEQMRLYGIPASITLAQGILESANGQSQLARNENNHFGIKASKSWLDAGGRYGLYTDDKPNEKFCSYDSVLDSYNHHSRVLVNSKRYAGCFQLDPSDYKGWAWGLDKAGYATAGKYAPSLIAIIERNDLAKYDRMVIEQMAKEGLKPGQGVAQATPGEVVSCQSSDVRGYRASAPTDNRQLTTDNYSFPLKRDEFMLVSSSYGNRTDAMDHNKTQFHKGIDISCNYEPLLATESNGKVVNVNQNVNTGGGKSVTVEYERPDKTKVQVTYMHMSSIGVKVGDTVTAGQQIGVSGNTGTRTTGPHLHFEVKQVSEDGTRRSVDPASYLADIAVRGNIGLTAMCNGKDLLDKYKVDDPLAVDAPLHADNNGVGNAEELDPEAWMKKLLSSEDSGVAMGGHGDPIVDMAMGLFTSLMAFAVAIDNKNEEEQMALATDSAISKQVDLTSLVPSMRSCVLDVSGKPTLVFNDGMARYSAELSQSDMNRISLILADANMSSTDKQQRISNLVGNVALTAQMSQNYDNALAMQGQSENMQMK